jgi:ATP-dependent Clp protease ATP-binding subunit ClpC
LTARLAVAVMFAIVHAMNWFDWAKKHLAKWKALGAEPREGAINFTPRAIQVLVLARKEAERLNHNFIGTEHVLVGLIELGNGVAVNILKKFGLNLENVRKEIERLCSAGSCEKISGQIPYTPRTKKVLARAYNEAQALGYKYAGTEHLLLGLLAETDGMAWRIFKMANIDYETIRKEILVEITPIISRPEDKQKEKS